MTATAPPAAPPAPARIPLGRRATDAARDRVDALLAFDPGFNQLLLAVGIVVGVAASLGIVYLFMQATHALWIEPPAGVRLPPAQLAALAAQHHGETLLAMLIGGIIGMLSTFAVVDTEPRQVTTTMALMPIPMLASMALSIQFLHDRTIGILAMAVVMGVGAYLPKFTPQIGQRAFAFGQMLFVGYLIGFLSRGAIVTHDLGWIAAVMWVAIAVNLVLKLAIFLPLRRGALDRTIRAFFARSQAVVVTAAELYRGGGVPGHERRRTRRRLARRLNRLNEGALIADALLETNAPIADEAHARLFDSELIMQNIGRLADALVDCELPGDVHRAIGDCLATVRDSHGARAGDGLETLRRYACEEEATRTHPLQTGRVIRMADALVGWTLARRRWRQDITPADREASVPFQPAVSLMFGNLPGSALVSREAAAPQGSWRARLGLDLPAQTAIRLTIAVASAAAIGSVLSERRFYWAVLAVFISFMGTFTSGEQVLKAINRVGGTVIGILLGSLLAHAIGASTWSVAVVLGALGLGIYFMRASYALMVIGITITVSQLYVQLGEYSNQLLLLRLEETAIGAAVAVLAAIVVFPVRTRQATRVATRDYYDLLGQLLGRIVARLEGDDDATPLSGLSRSLDSAGHQLRSAALPLARQPFRRDDVQHNLLLFGQASHHARNLAARLTPDSELGPAVREAAAATLRSQRRLIGALRVRLDSTISPGAFAAPADDGAAGPLTQELRRFGDLLGLALDDRGTLDERQFLRHLARLDETLAELGDNLSGARPVSALSWPGSPGRHRAGREPVQRA